MSKVPHDACIIMVGISGSGKSTVAKTISKTLPNSKILSSDHIREVELATPTYDPSMDHKVFSLLHERLQHRAQQGLPTILDTTGLRPTQRKQFAQIAARYSRPIILAIVDTDPKTAWDRNTSRSKKGERFVPLEAFEEQLKQLHQLKTTLAASRNKENSITYNQVLFY